jgi:hypothetical protein
MRPQKGRGIVISGGIVEVAELRRGTNLQSVARALLCCLLEIAAVSVRTAYVAVC